jgi:hypothetical protein
MYIFGRFLFFILVYLGIVNSYVLVASDNEEIAKQSILIPKKDFSPIKNEQELIEYVSSYFDKVNSINILDDDLKYDQDKLKYLAKNTGLNIGVIDKRVGRIVLDYNDGFSFGTGSFFDKKIFTNAHVLKRFPLSKELIFEQAISLSLQQDFDVDVVVSGLKKYKDSFLNWELYERDKEKIESILNSVALSLYRANDVNILKDYFLDVANHDIGYIDNYVVDNQSKDFSPLSFSYSKEKKLYEDTNLKKIFKLTHYPLGIPVQRTSYGLLDFKTKLHRMHTLGGSSGSLILNYNSDPIGFHSAGIKTYYPLQTNTTGFSFSETGNLYQDLSSFEVASEYLKLDKRLSSKLFSYFNNRIIKNTILATLTKNKIKM